MIDRVTESLNAISQFFEKYDLYGQRVAADLRQKGEILRSATSVEDRKRVLEELENLFAAKAILGDLTIAPPKDSGLSEVEANVKYHQLRAELVTRLKEAGNQQD